MTSLQRIIKYFAIALAAVIIISIVSATVFVLRGISWITSNSNLPAGELHSINIENTEINNLNIKIAATNLKIKHADTLKAETNNDNLEVIQNEKTLEIRDKDDNHFKNKNNEQLIIYVPENITLDQVDIEVGAGKVEVEAENISIKNFDFDLGAGSAEFKKLNVTNSAKISTGAGNVKISSGELKDLDFDMGAGNVKLSSKLTGNSEIDAGVGALDININGSKNDYRIKVSKGLGPIKLDNKNISNGTYGDGQNNIEINGGVGNINIKFE